MLYFIKQIIDWSEVWPLLIPLWVLYKHKQQPVSLQPVIVFLWVALPLYFFADIIWKCKVQYHFPHWLQSNNFIYNILSIARFILFAWFFININKPGNKSIIKLFILLFILFVAVNFRFENFFDANLFSSRLHGVETSLLLLGCLQYYFTRQRDEDDDHIGSPDFWVITGLGIYVTISFLVFIFHDVYVIKDVNIAIESWKITKFAYFILCIFIAKAFYVSPGKR